MMRTLFAGMIMLSASMAIVDTAQAQIQPQRPPGYRSMQAHDLDLKRIEGANQQLDLPASQDDITGAFGPVSAEEDALTKNIEQDNRQLDSEITDICPTCGL
jgi:hypothetical protein